uniref:Bardet-Biedl syndrome 2 protein homolog n=1 Tax=Strigamia maritima TaxID=126957 RepID=T1IM01_STRMM
MTETEAVTDLCLMQGSKFGYSLANGTVGVYDKVTRNWRIKSKNHATSIFGFDLDSDGIAELVTGWSNGKMDVRSDQSGEVIFKDNFSHSIAGLVQADYRLDGKTELICCSVDGEVRGFLPASGEIQQSLLDSNVEQDTIRDLVLKKNNLMMELQNYMDSSRVSDSIQSSSTSFDSRLGMIPADTQLQVAITVSSAPSDGNPHVQLLLETSNETVIRAVIVFAEGIFEGESKVVHPKDNLLSNRIRVPIIPSKDMPVDIHLKVLIGHTGSNNFHVFEVSRQLPRFSMYVICKDTDAPKPSGFVNFVINDRVQRVLLWLNQSFLLMEEIELPESNILDVSFLSLRTLQILNIKMEPNGSTTINTDDIDLAGNIIQALAIFLNINELATTCDFPVELEKLNQTLEKVQDYNSTRLAMMADTADHSSVIRSLIVRAEDCRLIKDYTNMKQWYVNLFDINKYLISNFKIRNTNHQELLNCLKIVNQTIQKAGQLRGLFVIK